MEGLLNVMIRTSDKTVTFSRPFYLKGVDRELPPADYRVTTQEELIEGLSFAAYRRVSTVIFVPAPYCSGVEMVTIDPLDLEAMQVADAALGCLGTEVREETNDYANERKKTSARLLSKLLGTHGEKGREALRARLLQEYSQLEVIESTMSKNDSARFEEISDLLELLAPASPALAH